MRLILIGEYNEIIHEKKAAIDDIVLKEEEQKILHNKLIKASSEFKLTSCQCTYTPASKWPSPKRTLEQRSER
jgi:hypothetical protein